ncbi:DesA family fatty acid desaturase [Isoalcanivorax indicus]|uniref:DesA family fatty acid desaturase n=1 Tax=Isoalcanivorax indicus TaxID=2202653 RepID=UPI000DBA99E4|nr:fatty acid desaturase [Isoalcanivorax indicus]
MWTGFFAPSVWQLVLITLALTHVTIVSVTIYLHRHSAHRALDLHPAVAHFFRFWLWLTTATVTKEWTAIHRKHHARCETPEDPHSPVYHGIGKVLREGAELYREEARNQETLDRYGAGTPDDWLERNVYTRHTYIGIYLMLAINIACFGAIGITVWAVQMMWIPVFAAGVINGLGHYWGYRNFESKDASRNISPIGILIGGEELHNNHHTYPNSAKLSVRRFEFDAGWFWIRVLETLRLAKVNKVPPRPVIAADKTALDLDTLRALMANRFQVMARYRKEVITPVFRDEKQRACDATRNLFSRARKLLYRDDTLITERHRARLDRLTAENETLATIYQYRLRLQEIWSRTSRNSAEMLEALKQWCQEAEQSGIRALQEFAAKLKAYTVPTDNSVTI